MMLNHNCKYFLLGMDLTHKHLFLSMKPEKAIDILITCAFPIFSNACALHTIIHKVM